MNKTHSLHQLYRRSICIALALCVGILGVIWLSYEYVAGANDIDGIEREFVESKKNELRSVIETIVGGIDYARLQSEKQTKELLKNRLNSALTQATDMYLKYKERESPTHIKQHVIDILMASPFEEGAGYYWIMDVNHTIVAHLYNQELVGKDLSELVDRQGKTFIKEFVQTALEKEDGGYVSYFWVTPETPIELQLEKGRKKIAFVKLFKPYNWVVGVSVFTEDIEKINQKKIISILDGFNSGTTGYIFNHTFDGICLNHAKKELIGTNRWELTSKDGKKLIQELNRVGCQPGGGFLEYIATINPKTGLPSRKLSYVKSIPEWQWVLGTGIYLDDIESKIASLQSIHNKRMEDRIAISLMLIALTFVISYLGANVISRKLNRELVVFMGFFSNASQHSLKIDTTLLNIEEFRKLATDFNSMNEKQEKAQQAVLQAKTEWERTFDAVPDTICILDMHHNIIRANRAMIETFSSSYEELIHTKCFKSVHGASEPPPYCPHVRLMVDKQSHTVEVFDETRQCYLLVTVSPLFDTDGIFFGSVHVARDITNQKKAELNRINTEEKLQKTEKMEAIGLMAGGVAHDLNNILSGIVSYPELLLMQLSKDDKLYSPIMSIRDAGKRAAAVVSDLLTVARGVAMVKKVVSINTLIQEYLDSPEYKRVESLHPEISLQVDLDPTLWKISCSSIHLLKMLMNLITNAMEAIEGKGTVSVSTENLSIIPNQINFETLDGDYIVVKVSDTGVGISKHALNHIFEPFYSSKVMGRSGTGLGLAVVWNTVKDHDGIINVESSDKGTSFTIYFRSSKAEVLPNSEKEITLENLNGSGTILVVDDEQQQRDVAFQMLSFLGYSVETVTSGAEAIRYCRNKAVDLVLLDMIMDPGINGLQTFKEIIKINPSQQAIIASGFSESAAVKATLQLGAGGFIKKPYTMEQLGKIIKKVMRC